MVGGEAHHGRGRRRDPHHRRGTPVAPELTWYAFAASLFSAAVWPIVAGFAGADPVGVYAAVGLVLVAAALVAATAPGARDATMLAAAVAAIAALPGAVLVLIETLPAVLSVAAIPYSWLGAAWAGQPGGVGLSPAGVDPPGVVTVVQAVALGVVAVASATAAYALTRRPRSAVAGLGVGGPTAILTALVAARVAWPVVPAATLAIGLVLILAVALVPVLYFLHFF